ncbi:hypothetical protein [Vibrio sinaloensis]|uniref:Uncharacterized protein n=1 Tax=Photobacterium sp. (strain ATCC 43367) TaxID=379097 RepID=A0A0A5HR51_PHOS4|nr:hypothetical protein [Vibrio sinaloensis]KGY06820.1 hypothetical protein NM06_20425 [Vibrio sinaloensis]
MSKGDTARQFYESARAELITHIRLSNQALFLFIASSAAIFTVGHSPTGLLEILLIIPFLGAGATVVVTQHDALSGGLAAYCNKEIRQALMELEQDIPQWDSCEFLKFYQPTLIKRRLLAHSLVLLPPSLISLYLNKSHAFAGGDSVYNPIWWIATLVTIYSFWVVFSNFLSRQLAYEKSII